MSRFTEGDDDYENIQLDQGRWEHNSRQALKGRKGRRALRELREALMALPEHRLIEGAVCTVGAEQRKAAYVQEAEEDWRKTPEQYRPRHPYSDQAESLEAYVARDGEGVCAVGALLWWRAVQAGTDPAEAFAALPDVGEYGDDGLDETASLAKQRAGLTYTLAWNLAYKNDETFRRKTPEERWQAFVDWIDAELAETAAA